MDDDAILDLFRARSEQAIRELDGKYGALCRRLAHRLTDSWPDAEECVNEAYLGIWNAIPPARPDSLPAYLCRLVRNISLKRRAFNRAQKRDGRYQVAMEELEDVLPAPVTPEEEVDAKRLSELLNAFLAEQPRENRVIFVRRYWFCDTYAQIARRVGYSEKNVSVRLARIRKRLKRYLMERGGYQ